MAESAISIFPSVPSTCVSSFANTVVIYGTPESSVVTAGTMPGPGGFAAPYFDPSIPNSGVNIMPIGMTCVTGTPPNACVPYEPPMGAVFWFNADMTGLEGQEAPLVNSIRKCGTQLIGWEITLINNGYGGPPYVRFKFFDANLPYQSYNAVIAMTQPYGQWVHFGFSINGPQYNPGLPITFFVDGMVAGPVFVEYDFNNIGVNIGTNNNVGQGLSIAQTSIPGYVGYQGSIAQLEFFSNALTLTQVQAIYNQNAQPCALNFPIVDHVAMAPLTSPAELFATPSVFMQEAALEATSALSATPNVLHIAVAPLMAEANFYSVVNGQGAQAELLSTSTFTPVVTVQANALLHSVSNLITFSPVLIGQAVLTPTSVLTASPIVVGLQLAQAALVTGSTLGAAADVTHIQAALVSSSALTAAGTAIKGASALLTADSTLYAQQEPIAVSALLVCGSKISANALTVSCAAGFKCTHGLIVQCAKVRVYKPAYIIDTSTTGLKNQVAIVAALTDCQYGSYMPTATEQPQLENQTLDEQSTMQSRIQQALQNANIG
jgi:hypothetical protein